MAMRRRTYQISSNAGYEMSLLARGSLCWCFLLSLLLFGVTVIGVGEPEVSSELVLALPELDRIDVLLKVRFLFHRV